MHARISIKTCVGRQTRGIDAWGEGGRNIPYECRACDQGTRILALAGNLENAESTEPKRLEGVKEMADPRFERKRGCSNCLRDKSLQSSCLCYVCQRAASGKKGEERVAALAEVKRKIDAGEIRTRVSKHNVASAPVAQTKPAPPVQHHAPGGVKHAPESRPYRLPEEVISPSGAVPSIVPVTLRLSIEITVRVSTVSA